jgi:hypothetical protein
MEITITTDGSKPRCGQCTQKGSDIYIITKIITEHKTDLFTVDCDAYDYGIHAGDDKKTVWPCANVA